MTIESPDWLVAGAPHVWRPYCQMKTAPATSQSGLSMDIGRSFVA